MTMSLTSSSFPDGGEIPQQHGKKIKNVSPQLAWTGAPEETRSFALSMIDTHPIAQGYLHWLVVDLDPATTFLPEDAADGSMPTGSRQLRPYAGPFPPASSGTHAYEFTLYALSTGTLPLAGNASFEAFQTAINDRTLATAQLVGHFATAR